MKYVVANWKMYTDTRGGIALTREIVRRYRGKETMPEVVVCPGFLALGEIKKVISRGRMHIGAQDVFWMDDGPHTGSVAPKMLKEIGCEYVIVGHSERRQELGETNEMIARKIDAAVKAGLKAILCVGENLEERENGSMEKVVEFELRGALEKISSRSMESVIIAYEPIWALSEKGHGSASVQDVLDALSFVRKMLVDISAKGGKDVSLLYGGSVDMENAYSFLREDSIDGVLVGSASVKINHICGIIDSALKAMRV